jgi:hypothetical protein
MLKNRLDAKTFPQGKIILPSKERQKAMWDAMAFVHESQLESRFCGTPVLTFCSTRSKHPAARQSNGVPGFQPSGFPAPTKDRRALSTSVELKRASSPLPI